MSEMDRSFADFGHRHLERGRRLRLGRPTARRFVAAFTFGILGVFAVSAGALAAFESSNSGRILPGTHVGSVDLSGLTPSEARSRLNDAYAALGLRKQCFLSFSGKQPVRLLNAQIEG
jgi:hypothetical protein